MKKIILFIALIALLTSGCYLNDGATTAMNNLLSAAEANATSGAYDWMKWFGLGGVTGGIRRMEALIY